MIVLIQSRENYIKVFYNFYRLPISSFSKMAFRLKHILLKCVKDSLSASDALKTVEKAQQRIQNVSAEAGKVTWKMKFYLDNWEEYGLLSDIKMYENQIVEAGMSKSLNVRDISDCGREMHFEVNLKDFIRDVLNSKPSELSFTPTPKKVLVEFSSPNIAKEFHVGHFRSTIIGNYVANMKRKFGNNVITVNYLGDWGTQFGLLMVGLELLGYSEESLNTSTIEKLTAAYVFANKKAHVDDKIMVKAKEIFEAMERGDEQLLRKWERLKKVSEKDLSTIYDKLGIKFDEYEWESMYGKARADPFLKDLSSKGLVALNNGQYVMNLDEDNAFLTRSDGTTLYLLRDVLAFFDRRNRHNFDKAYYVVDNGQGGHMNKLQHICERIEANSSAFIEHVKIGRIIGMSTRAGTNVFLQDVLSEGQERMYKKQVETKTTKCTPNETTAAILGITCVLTNDMKRKRMADYRFEWEKALQINGLSGIRLQYTHCRLVSLMKYSGASAAQEVQPDMLMEPEAIQLVVDIAMFEDTLVASERELEPRILVNYLFQLTKSINKCFESLHVKNSGEYLSGQRLLLFNVARSVLAEGMRILGITPLQEM